MTDIHKRPRSLYPIYSPFEKYFFVRKYNQYKLNKIISESSTEKFNSANEIKKIFFR